MAEAARLKDWFTPSRVRTVGRRIADVCPGFTVRRWVRDVDGLGRPFAELELTERTARLAAAIAAEFARIDVTGTAALDVIVAALPPEADESSGDGAYAEEGFGLWPYADFVKQWTIDHGDTSNLPAVLDACRELTTRFTAEFAIRPALQQFPEAMDTVLSWTAHPNEHVRRLASEGTRSRLPWASRLHLPVDQVLEVLGALRNDPSLYVRRSVANHLNDLAKDDPDRIIPLMQEWKDDASAETLWIIRHAMRNHLKAGTPAVLSMFGYEPPEVSVEKLSCRPAKVAIGGSVEVKFRVEATSSSDQLLMVDLVLGYQKANGTISPKVFKFREFTLKAGASEDCAKRFDMVHRSTRRLHPGDHTVTIRINGRDLATAAFSLTP